MFKNIVARVIGNFRPLWEQQITAPEYGSGRILLNRIAIDGLASFNLFDLMFGNRILILAIYINTVFWDGVHWPHNDYLMLMWTYGISGLLIYIYLLYIFPWRRYNGNNRLRLITFQLSIFALSMTAGFINYSAIYLFIVYYAVFYEENWNTNCCI